MDNEVKIEVNEVANFVTTRLISFDSMVTCGKCKKEMKYQEYDSEHCSSHYNLCWLDGIEDEIDFTVTSQVQAILKKYSNKQKTKVKFKCEWCDEIKLSIVGFASHLTKCKKPELCVNDTVLENPQNNSVSSIILYNDDSVVKCGRCEESMRHTEFNDTHRYKHYNLCWLDGEEKLDYLNENKITTLVREILPRLIEQDKKVVFTCEWCADKRKSLSGFVSHVKKCAIKQNLVLPPKVIKIEPVDETDSLQPMNNELNPIYDSDSTITCGLCNTNMLYKDYNETHKTTHYNLCWIVGDEKPDFDNETTIQHLLRQTLPKHAAHQKKVKFICEWCEVEKKSVVGFASHIKRCQSRPDQLIINDSESENNTSMRSNIEISKERDESMVTCGRCNKEMTFKEYRLNHSSKHYKLCWIVGEEKLDLENYDVVLSKLKQFVPFSVIRKRSVKLTCEDCKTVKKSIPGFASHVIFCNKTANDVKLLLIRCEDCGNKIKPASLSSHKLKNCKGVIIKSKNADENNYAEEAVSFKLRRKRRPPNVLSLHPDTKFVTEYYDLICRLCDFVSLNFNDITNHILMVHDINLNNIKNKRSITDCISNKYGVHRNIYLKPLLNYYTFFEKTFWKANFHEDFKSDIKILNNDEALKYMPSVHQSCQVFSSNDEQICVDLFKSAYVNGMYWLFTGGPNWALSWCPVPKEVQTQHLAISCHPKPDMAHKKMQIYKYPSLVQLWTFNSLSNINYESVSDMPYMSYGLAHEFGAVWDMAWCPSGAYEPKTKIGLLALSTSCGDCPIFPMPCVDANSKMFYIFKVKPVIARNFDCEWNIDGVQCTKVCWQTVKPFKTLICGYSNGAVSVFNINFKSIFLIDDVLYPSHTFRASRCSITGLSVNHLNPSVLSTTAIDGCVTLWDLKSTENPIFQKKSYCPSDCTWLQQCYTLVHCSKGVNPLFLKVRTINFSNCDDDVDSYNPELYILKNVAINSKIISDYNDKLNSNVENCDDTDGRKTNKNAKITNDFNMNSDNESYKSDESYVNSDEEKSNFAGKSGNASKIEEDDFYGPTFFQKGIHWSVSTSDWMNVIATGNESGAVYEKLYLPETNNLRKGNSTILQLMVRKLSNDPKSELSNCYHFDETVKEFGLETKFLLLNEDLTNNPNDSKPLLRYPLDNITKVSWNQNFSSFRWLAIGTQSGFTLITPSQTISDNCIESFYKII